MKTTTTQTCFALAVVALAPGCFLPPPAQNKALTEALESDVGGNVLVEDAMDFGSQNGQLGMASDPSSTDAGGRESGRAPEPLDGTAIVEVQAAAREELEKIGGVDGTVAVQIDEPPPPQVEPPGPGRAVTPPQEGDRPTATDSTLEYVDEAPVTLIPLEVETSDGLIMSYLFKDADKPVGGAPAVIFIHGWCGRASQWSDAMEKTAADRRVYAVDLIGHGRSSGQNRAEWSISRFGGDIVHLLEDQKLENVVLVGHGMGGQVALSAAARAPGRIAGILGVDCLQRLAGDPDPSQVEPHVKAFTLAYGEQMRRFVDEAAHESTDPMVKERIIEDTLAADKAAALALMQHFGVHDPRREAPKVECGVVCINSDSLETDLDGNRSLLSSFELRTIENTGHWIHLESPIAFVQELKAYLDGLAFRAEPVSILETLNPVLLARDVGATTAFYTGKLGFEIIRRRPQDLTEEPLVVTLERDNARVVIQAIESMQNELPEASVAAGRGVLFLRVGVLDVELHNLGTGVVVISPKRVLTSGAKQAVIADPEGNIVVLQENAGASSAK